MDKLLDIKNFNVTYKNKNKSVYAVKNANFSINRGDSLGIVGESGSGKSTIAMALLRLLPEATTLIDGKAEFLGKDLVTMPKEELLKLRWNHLAVVFQKSMNSLSPVHRIGEQIEDIYRVHKPNATKEEVLEKIKYLLKLVNLPERVYRLYPHEMSGGMLQRVSIAISLIFNPDLLILDEATTALDVITQGQILSEIVEMEKELDTTRIMITHDMSVVAASCNKIAVMYAGEFMEIGLTEDVMRNPKHPYTKGLLKSFPSLKGEKSELSAIRGYLPDLSLQYEGCVFAPRCDFATEACKNSKPTEYSLPNDHMVKCVLCGGEQIGK